MIIFQNFMQNCQPVFFKLYEGEEEIIDMDGNSTGQYIPKYSALKSAMLCVSPNKGTSETEQFGSIEDYDRTMTTSDPDCEIDEDAVLWVDGADTSGPWNYIVKQRAPWKNSVSYAIQQVAVSAYEDMQKKIKDALELRAKMAEAANAENNAESV